MKTTDLIPIILYHLKSGDKYGLELVNDCNECSGGKIVVKQPTLYSLLKKLEKSQFITSFWKDSDIGGKRHYYKITPNGLAQLETYPPLEDLVKTAIENDDADDIFYAPEAKVEPEVRKSSPSPFDNLNLSFDTPKTESSVNSDDQSKEKPVENETENSEVNENTVDDSDNLNDEIKSNITNSIDENNSEVEEVTNEVEDYSSLNSDDNTLSYQQNENEEKYTDITETESQIDNNLENSENVYETSDTEYTNDNRYQDSELTTNSKVSDKEENDNINNGNTDDYQRIDNTDSSKIESPIEDSKQVEQIDVDVKDILKKIKPDDEPISENSEPDEITSQVGSTNNNKTVSIFDALSFNDENEDAEVVPGNIIKEKKNEATSPLELNNPFYKDNTDKNLDEKSLLEINRENAEMIKDNGDTSEKFVKDKKVSTFTSKPILPADNSEIKSTEITSDIKNTPTNISQAKYLDEIPYKDYIDLKSNKQIVHAKHTATMKLLKEIFFTIVALGALISTFVVCVKNKITPLYIVVSILITLFVVYRLLIYISKYKTKFFKYYYKPITYNFKIQAIVRSIIWGVFVIGILILNLVKIKNTLFSMNNFGNFSAMLILSTLIYLDFLFDYIFLSKIIKGNRE